MGSRLGALIVGVGACGLTIVEAVTTGEADGHCDRTSNAGKLDFAWHGWIAVANLGPFGEDGAGCNYCLRGNDGLGSI